MKRVVVLLLALSGCSHEIERDALATAVQGPVRGAPHGALIREVAATEAGDAAISIDEQGGIRVWPALDGSREPVPVFAPAPAAVAIAADGDELMTALLDQAGAAQVVRMGRDGRIRGRAQVPGDVRIEQIAAWRDGFVVRRADQSIEQIDRHGGVRARLVAEPGEQIARVAVRGDAAVAMIAQADGTTTSMRWIDRGFAWGARVTLPVALWPESVSLSPSHQRLAGAEAKSRQLFVLDLRVKPAVVVGTSVQTSAGEPTGFVDEDHVAAMGASPHWWTPLPSPTEDPWAPTTPPSLVPGTSIGAACNGFVVVGASGSLALSSPARTRYLGWNEVGAQNEVMLDAGVAMTFSPSHIAWLDNDLVERRVVTLRNPPETARAVDDRHLIIQRHQGADLHIAMIDIDHPEREIALGDFRNATRFDYEPTTHVYGVGEGEVERRYVLDFGHGTVTPLPALKVRADGYFRLLDPALDDGVVAVDVVSDPNSQIELLRDRAGASALRDQLGYVVAVDDRGHVYTRDNDATVYRDGAVVAKHLEESVVPDHGGGAFATFGATGVTMFDAQGQQRWRATMWSVFSASFTPDDKRVLVRAPGGLVMLDAVTGKRIATACGWSFGLHDEPPVTTPLGQGSVCEDSER